jgi:hypothetical protein
MAHTMASAEAWTIIEETGNMLEDANYHSVSSVPSDIWHRISHLIPDDKKIEVAKAIAESFRI